MTITRKSLADTYAEHDAIIEAAQTAKREATLAYRGQLDGLGMDKDNIKAEIEGFKLAYRRKVAIEKKGEDVVEHRDAIADEIFLEITTSNAPRATRVEIIEEFDPATGEFKPVGNDADGAEDQVQVATVRASSSANISTAARKDVPGSLPVIETHPQKSDLGDGYPLKDSERPLDTEEGSPQSQVAGARAGAQVPPVETLPRHEVEEADEGEVTPPVSSVPHSEPASPPSEIAEPGDRGAVVPSAAPVVEPFVAEYAEPGVVVVERCPPEGIVAHPFAACWPVNPINVTGGVRQPIVKVGKLILDGRGRYFAARDAGIEYPVVQYDGTDPLLDCIRWNLASRKPSEQQRRLIAQKLAKLEPSRADDIMRAFDRHLEVAE